VTLLNCIREVSWSNLGLNTDYPGILHDFSSSVPRECWDSSLEEITIASFNIISNQTLINHTVACRPTDVQRPGDKNRCWVTASQTNTFPREQMNYNNGELCFLRGSCQGAINGTSLMDRSRVPVYPSGGGIEYFQRGPTSRKSQIWDSKMWLWVPLDSDPRKSALARAISSCKRQTHLLVRDDGT
jgi:hypothetical protein